MVYTYVRILWILCLCIANANALRFRSSFLINIYDEYHGKNKNERENRHFLSRDFLSTPVNSNLVDDIYIHMFISCLSLSFLISQFLAFRKNFVMLISIL